MKMKYSVSRRAQGFVSRTAVMGPPIRTTGHHFTMGADSESEEEQVGRNEGRSERHRGEDVLLLHEEAALEDLEGSFELEGSDPGA